jgi:CAAX protease family protein
MEHLALHHVSSGVGDVPEAALSPPVHTGAALAADDAFAARLRGFGPLGIVAILLILLIGNVILGRFLVLPLGGVLVLGWAWLSRTPWSELGYARPASWARTVAGGVALGVAFKLLMKAVVMPLLGADPINQAYHFLAGNRSLLPVAVFSMIVGAGFGEETLFRGFAFERLGKLFGPGAGAKTAIVAITSVWFGLVHYPVQGLAGAEQALIVGLVFGTIFAATRSLWMLMCAHAAFDLTALAIIYWDVEAKAAHIVFK